ncbi:MAG: glycosyl hydrolase family 8, partial [Sarcina sp.]
MKKKIIISISIIISILLILMVVIYPYFKTIHVNVNWDSKEKNTSEKLVYDFINTALTKEGIGIYTNYLNNESDGDITKGHYVLSESEGLMMLYAVNSGNKDLFDKNYNIVKNKMKLDNGLISWRVNENEKSEVSATIDELRIIKALIFAYDRWGDFKYKLNAIRISNALLKNSTLDGNLIDFTQPDGKSKTITLCYLDLVTMRMLSNIDSKWSSIY